MEIAKEFHMSIDLDFLKSTLLKEDNVKMKIYSENSVFLSSKQAIKSIERLQKKTGWNSLPIGKCDNITKEGRCNGHKPSKEWGESRK